MPLESLRQPFDPEQAGHKLREVQTEQEPTKNEAARHYAELKKSEFYVPEGDAWLIDEVSGVHRTADQLWAAVVETHLDPQHAAKKMEALRSGKWFDGLNGYWLHSEEAGSSKLYDSASNLVYALYLAEAGNGTEARNYYNKIRETALYNKESNAWKATNEESGLPFENTLLDILVVAKFDFEDAKRKFEAIRNQHLFNFAHPDQSFRSQMSRNHLLAVLVELQFDPKLGEQHFEELRASVLYDKKMERWRTRTTQLDEYCTSRDQLISVYIESTIERGKEYSGDPKPKLPEERNF